MPLSQKKSPISDRKTVKKKGRSPGRPKRVEVEKMYNEMLDVALRHFIEKGYGATSLSDIVLDAKISKTTLYSRFSSKQELFYAVLQRQSQRFSTGVGISLRSASQSLEEGLIVYANYVLKVVFGGDAYEVNRLIFSEGRRFPEVAKLARERMDLGTARMAVFIRERAEQDDIPCRNPEAAAETFMALISGLYFQSMASNQKVSRKSIRYAVKVFVAGRHSW